MVSANWTRRGWVSSGESPHSKNNDEVPVPLSICVVSSTRADWSKLAPLLEAMCEDPLKFKPRLLLIGSHMLREFGSTGDQLLKKFPHLATAFINQMAGDNEVSMVNSVGMIMLKLPEFLLELQAQVVIVHGDRYEAFGAASVASMMNLPVVHIEGGELSGTVDGVLRHAITKLSHLHFVCSPDAYRRVRRLGEHPDSIFECGCPSYAGLLKVRDSSINVMQKIVEEDPELLKPGIKFEKKKFLMVTYHPTTLSPTQCRAEYRAILEAIFTLKMPTILFYPNTDPNSKALLQILHDYQKKHPDFLSWLTTLTTVPFELNATFMRDCAVFVGNSSAGIRESCIFGTPTINVGYRQKGRSLPVNVTTILEPTAELLIKEISRLKEIQFPSECKYGTGEGNKEIVNQIWNSWNGSGDNGEYTISKVFVKDFYEPSFYTNLETAVGNVLNGSSCSSPSSSFVKRTSSKSVGVTLGLVTARGGSKGIPGKNIIDFCGKPLVAHTVEAALGAKTLDRVIISTDSDEIAKAAERFGVEVPFMRPKEFARDTSPHMDCIVHALEEMKRLHGYEPEFVVILQPTSPLRISADIDGAVELMRSSPLADAVVAITEGSVHPCKSWFRPKVGSSGEVRQSSEVTSVSRDSVCGVDDTHNAVSGGSCETDEPHKTGACYVPMQQFLKSSESGKYLRRQDLPKMYVETGSVYVYRCSKLLERHQDHFTFQNVLGYEIPIHRSQDIDTPFDLHMARMLAQNPYVSSLNENV